MSKSKQRINQALISLMKEQAYNTIQVKDLVECAGIARATFYLHFKSKEEVLKNYIDDMFELFYHQIENELDLVHTLDEKVVTRLFLTFAAEPDFSQVMIHPAAQAILLGRFRSYIARIIGRLLRNNTQINIEKNQLSYVIDYWAGGSLLLITQWVSRGFEPDAHEMGALYAKLTLAAIKEFILEADEHT